MYTKNENHLVKGDDCHIRGYFLENEMIKKGVLLNVEMGRFDKKKLSIDFLTRAISQKC